MVGTTSEYYNTMIHTEKVVTGNRGKEFPHLGAMDYKVSRFVRFQGWIDGAIDDFLRNMTVVEL